MDSSLSSGITAARLAPCTQTDPSPCVPKTQPLGNGWSTLVQFPVGDELAVRVPVEFPPVCRQTPPPPRPLAPSWHVMCALPSVEPVGLYGHNVKLQPHHPSSNAGSPSCISSPLPPACSTNLRRPRHAMHPRQMCQLIVQSFLAPAPARNRPNLQRLDTPSWSSCHYDEYVRFMGVHA